MKIYEYTITLMKREKKSSSPIWEFKLPFIWKNLRPLYQSNFFEIGRGILPILFLLFLYYLLLIQGIAIFFKNKIESPLPKESSLVEIGPVVREKKILNFRQCILAILLLSPLGKGATFHLNKLKPLSPKDALCQVWLKLARWFWR